MRWFIGSRPIETPMDLNVNFVLIRGSRYLALTDIVAWLVN